MDKIIEHVSNALQEISSAKEANPEYDDLKKSASFKSMPAPIAESLDYSESQETVDGLFKQEKLMKESDAPDILQWSWILALI